MHDDALSKEYEPAVHCKQEPPASAYVPATQLVHDADPSIEDVPAPHVEQDNAPASEKVPAGQRPLQTSVSSPMESPNRPAGQIVQEDDPASE